MNYYLKCLQQYADFKGRARRKEYWMFFLFNALFAAAATIIDYILGLTIFAGLYSLAMFIPSLAVSIRRLHDIGKSGWMYLFVLIPGIGFIFLLILFCLDSQPGKNQWGNNPKEYDI